MNGDLVLSSTLQGDLDANSFFAMFDAVYTISDNWAINAQIISISANNSTPLVFFDEDVRLGATITYSF